MLELKVYDGYVIRCKNNDCDQVFKVISSYDKDVCCCPFCASEVDYAGKYDEINFYNSEIIKK